MTDIVEFLRARLDEDEAQARHAIAGDLDYLPSIRCKCGGGFYIGGDAERVLREVEAKRDAARAAVRVLFPSQDRRGDFWDGQRAYAEASLRTLASIYADHPDHDPEWR